MISGDYGPMSITKSISIVNDGAGTASVRASGVNGVTIDAAGPADDVHLRGLSITGDGTASSAGISANNVGSLTIYIAWCGGSRAVLLSFQSVDR